MGTLSKTVRFSLYPSQWVRNWCDYLDLTSLKFLMLWFVMIFQGIFMVFLWFLVGFYGFSFFLSFPPSMMGFFTKPSGPMFWASLTIVFPMVVKHRSSDAMFAMYRWSLPSGDQLAGWRPWSASWQQHTRWSNWRQLVLIDIWSSLTDIPSEVQTFFEMIGLETLTHFYFCVCGDLYCEDLEQTNTKSKTVQNKS